MMIKLYHGTTFENYLKIQKEGFNPSSVNWNCSDDRYIYFYNPINFIEHEEAEEEEEAIQRAIERAFENAQLTAAIQKSLSDKTIVIEIEVDEENIEEDNSCNNMELACKVDIDHLEITNITRIYYADFCPHIGLIYLVGMLDNNFINLDLSPVEKTMLKALSKIDYIPEEISFPEYQEYII